MRLPTLLFAVASLTAPAHAQTASEDRQDVGGWTIITRYHPDQAINPVCIMIAPTSPDRTTFRLDNRPKKGVKTKSGSAYMRYTVPDSPARGATVQAMLDIPGRLAWQGEALYEPDRTKGRISLFLAEDIEPVLSDIGKGDVITLRTPENEYTLSLRGSFAAVREYQNCLVKTQAR